MNDVRITVTGKWLKEHEPRTKPFRDFIDELRDECNSDGDGTNIVLQRGGHVVTPIIPLGSGDTPDGMKVFLTRHHGTTECTAELRDQYFQQPAVKYKDLFLHVHQKELVSIPFDLYLALKKE